MADPGGVSISGAAHEHVRGRVEAEFIDLGEKALKNIARPVRVYAVRVDAGPSGSPSDMGDRPSVILAYTVTKVNKIITRT